MSIPTQFSNTNFRSRLEAKWASFFNLLGWEWEYEPVDFNGWIPDFVLTGGKRPVYVEIKPIFEVDPETVKKIRNKTDETILLLGATLPRAYPYLPDHGKDRPLCVGWCSPHVNKGVAFQMSDFNIFSSTKKMNTRYEKYKEHRRHGMFRETPFVSMNRKEVGDDSGRMDSLRYMFDIAPTKDQMRTIFGGFEFEGREDLFATKENLFEQAIVYAWKKAGNSTQWKSPFNN